jgi:hypothetical protein
VTDRADLAPPVIEDVERELGSLISDAVSFIESDFVPKWEQARVYYDGGSSIPKVDGRSKVTVTAVRDAIRNAKPSLLRIFLAADAVVEYLPEKPAAQQQAWLQSCYVNSLFWRSNGYRVLNGAMHDALLNGLGVVKFWWDDSPKITTVALTALTPPDLELLAQAQDAGRLVFSTDPVPREPAVLPDGSQVPLHDLTVRMIQPAGRVRVEHIPLSEFVFDENATSIEEARVVAHRRSMRMGDAVALGLPLDLLADLDDYDAETDTFAGESELRRGFLRDKEAASVDPAMRKVLITEAYARYDLDGTGLPQLWRFWLGGTNYKLLAYEPAEFVPFAGLTIDPEPHTVVGRSLFDVLAQEQDTLTSLLRAACDNAHLSNNRRLAVHEQLVNIDDVLNPALGAPIRVRAPGQIQDIGVQSTIASMLPLLQFLKQEAEIKVGITNAAMGLDHDALQSTTREAARNTILLSQGQIEVMARNLAEGMSRVFDGLLRLAMRHPSPQEYAEVSGSLVPVDLTTFDPSMHMRPRVGLGTGRSEDKLAGLQIVLAQQKETLAALAPGNPIVGYHHIANTLEDIARLHGLYNTARYFNPVTPETNAALAEAWQQAKAQEPPPVDPGRAMIEAELVKAQVKEREMILDALLEARKTAIENLMRAAEFSATDDFKRDELAQRLAIADTRHAAPVDMAAVRREQEKRRAPAVEAPPPANLPPLPDLPAAAGGGA